MPPFSSSITFYVKMFSKYCFHNLNYFRYWAIRFPIHYATEVKQKYRANSYLIKQIFHSDYFSGWDEIELQRVLDNCDNPSEAANPDAFCSDWLTFRGKGKEEGVQTQDDEIRYVT